MLLLLVANSLISSVVVFVSIALLLSYWEVSNTERAFHVLLSKEQLKWCVVVFVVSMVLAVPNYVALLKGWY